MGADASGFPEDGMVGKRGLASRRQSCTKEREPLPDVPAPRKPMMSLMPHEAI